MQRSKKQDFLRQMGMIAVFSVATSVGVLRADDEVSKNIGYPTVDAVPLCSECLAPQEVFDQDTMIYTGSAAEPTVAVNPQNGKHIVAAWQQDRINNGGSLECGIAFSRDGGRKWRRTFVPFQKCLGGISQRVSNMWLSYAEDGSRVYLSVLFFNANYDLEEGEQQSGVAVSISCDDGESWTEPAILYSSETYLNEPADLAPMAGKTSITADPNLCLNAYAVWNVFDNLESSHAATYLSWTSNGGKSWKPVTLLYDPAFDPSLESNNDPLDCATTGNAVVVLPKATPNDKVWQEDDWGDDLNKAKRFSGDLLNFMQRIYAAPGATDNQYVNDTWPFSYTIFDIAVTRSANQGRLWSQIAIQINDMGMDDPLVFTGGYTYAFGEISGGIGQLLRTGSTFPSYNVNPKNGFLYVVYQTGQLRSDGLPSIAMQTSRDGGYTWSDPAMVSKTPAIAPNPQAFTPFVAIDDEGRVGVLYYDTRFDRLSNPANTPTDAWLAIYKEVKNAKGGSTGIGLDFVKEVRLTPQSFNAQNGPQTSDGIMSVGDSISLDAHGDDFYAVYTAVEHGPYSYPILFLQDEENNATIQLDENLRQFPYFSKVDDE